MSPPLKVANWGLLDLASSAQGPLLKEATLIPHPWLSPVAPIIVEPLSIGFVLLAQGAESSRNMETVSVSVTLGPQVLAALGSHSAN